MTRPHSYKDFLFSLPERCQRYLPAAFSGDPEAASSVVNSAPNEQRGHIVRAFFELGIPTKAFREALISAWDHDHVFLFEALGSNRRSFNKVFRYADFEKSHLPSRFTIYRGGYGEFFDQAWGISWTRNRDCACWFAMRRANPKAAPIVLRREVTRRGVLAHVDTRNEDEIIVAGVSHTFVDGEPADWRQGYKRYETQKQEEQAV